MVSRPSLAERLDLAPHPEGGWFRETWRSPVSCHPDGYGGPRSAATAIYYLLCPGERSRWHVVRSDELWLWHHGGPLELRLGGRAEEPVTCGAAALDGDIGFVTLGGEIAVVTLGGDVVAGQQPQVRVPGGVWQSAAPAGGSPVLVSCVVAPGFDFADFRLHRPAREPGG